MEEAWDRGISRDRGRTRWTREGENEGEDKKGAGGGYDEATEEKTRLHVTSSPKPIWSQSVFHYQKPRRALYQIVHSPFGDPCKTHRNPVNAPGTAGSRGSA